MYYSKSTIAPKRSRTPPNSPADQVMPRLVRQNAVLSPLEPPTTVGPRFEEALARAEQHTNTLLESIQLESEELACDEKYLRIYSKTLFEIVVLHKKELCSGCGEEKQTDDTIGTFTPAHTCHLPALNLIEAHSGRLQVLMPTDAEIMVDFFKAVKDDSHISKAGLIQYLSSKQQKPDLNVYDQKVLNFVKYNLPMFAY